MKSQVLTYVLVFTLLAYAEVVYRYLGWRIKQSVRILRHLPTTPSMMASVPRDDVVLGAGSVREYIQLHPWHSASCVLLVAALAGILAAIADMKGLITLHEKGTVWHYVFDEPIVVEGKVSEFRWFDAESVTTTTSFSAVFALCRRRPWHAG